MLNKLRTVRNKVKTKFTLKNPTDTNLEKIRKKNFGFSAKEMSDSGKMPLHKQGSLSHIEQSLKIIPSPPPQAPVTIYPGPKAGNQNLSKADLEIADRLEKLRKSHVEEVPTEEEMALRLAKLKGLQSDHYTKSANHAYQPPDSRTQVEKSEDLLKQVMGEVALDSKISKPEDELQARLLALRGDTKVEDSSTTSSLNSNVFSSSASSEPRKHEKALHDEIANLMREAQCEVNNASSSVKLLKKDPTIKAALAEAASKRGKTVRSTDSTSSDELCSGDDDVDERENGSSDNASRSNQTEKDEVNRIINLYTQKARRRKEKRKLRALKQKEKRDKAGSSSSSDRELSDSDINSQPTSESEKFSDSD